MQPLTEIVFRKNGIPQRLAVADRNQMQPVERFGFRLAPQDNRFAGLMVYLPVTERDNDDLESESFRLMDGKDTDGILRIRGSDCFTVSRLIPPLQEAGQIGTFFLGILRYHIEKRLNEDLFVILKFSGEKTEKSF